MTLFIGEHSSKSSNYGESWLKPSSKTPLDGVTPHLAFSSSEPSPPTEMVPETLLDGVKTTLCARNTHPHAYPTYPPLAKYKLDKFQSIQCSPEPFTLHNNGHLPYGTSSCAKDLVDQSQSDRPIRIKRKLLPRKTPRYKVSTIAMAF
uniref:Uncharacterized protein n=1 Tax=Tanacetum cinerariifolium TaxID=118510 RepID=A0A699IHY6_TANCI|nr:hypothetical protein [Tanacetum cinerariifolium]